MARSLRRVRQHRADRGCVGLVDGAAPAHLALSLRALLREDVALVGARALDAAAAAHVEALRGAALGLHLRHNDASFSFSLTPGGPRLHGDASNSHGHHLSPMAAYAAAGLAEGTFFGSAFG